MDNKYIYIDTQGCQMNEYDSDKMLNLMENNYNMLRTASPDNADLLILNTCSIREKAQENVFSTVGRWRKIKEKKPDIVIAVAGCVASQEGQEIFKELLLLIWFLARKLFISYPVYTLSL